ncbi:MAG TPA: type II toxin-antitoxin system MqsA family antitoxin [Thermoanaerobaculia bacterium]|nr:type II toxin-antitoxin system MqsA family antitoxin [Thermoanaerobaculia bacterium]
MSSERLLPDHPLEDEALKCHVCGSTMVPVITDLPFKLSEKTIVIVKALPVLQCEGCSEYVLEDSVMQEVDAILERADPCAELEIIRYAA